MYDNTLVGHGTAQYTDVTDDDFYQFINKRYSRYQIPKRQKSLQQICFPKRYEFQLPQKFLAEFINPHTPYRGVLVYHRIGAGKTCTAISISEKFKNHKRIMIVLPASLKGNFRSELRSYCAGEKYLTDKERKMLATLHPSELAYLDIIKRSDERINKYYTIYSYNKFVNIIKDNKLRLDNTLLIIDEIHNMISETGTYYENLYHVIHSAAKSMRLVIMSATPIFDKPAEIALTMNLLLNKQQMPTGRKFYDEFVDVKYTNRGPTYQVKNMDVFKDYIRGYVSYFRGAAPQSFPRVELHFVKCKMSDLQLKLYRKIVATEDAKQADNLAVDISNNFLVGTRMVSNFVFPNMKINQKGYDSLTDDDLSIANIREYSPKFLKILRKIKKCEGTVFVYSNFKEYGGIKTFSRMLEHHHYKNYEVHGGGRKRFAVWSGDQATSVKDEIKAVFNNINNVDGSQIKVILGSPSIKEGVTLLRVQEVHLIEPYWNFSRMEQIMGRAIRFCSHKDVAFDQQLVKVYIYLAVHPKIDVSVDEKIMKMALDKRAINLAFETAMKESAIDCHLFKNANVYPGEEDIKCLE